MPAADPMPTAAQPHDRALPTPEHVHTAVTSFAMLAEPTRLRLLWLLSAEELDVSSLAARIDVSVPTASAHLAKLRLAGFVDSRRDGRRVLYQARDRRLRRLIAEALPRADHRAAGSTGRS